MTTTFTEIEAQIRLEERDRAAAILRAYADTRPAGEVPSLLAIAHTIETGIRHTIPEPPPVCAACGHSADDHPYRHQFKPRNR
jgi:hypothetical protein